jgi:hypothetical protein
MIFCRIAEGSYLALKKVKKGITLGPRDKQAIKNAMEFLNNAKRGEEAFKKREMSQDALSASYAFKEAFSAGVRTYNESETAEVLSTLDKIISSLKDIEENKKSRPKDIDNLIKFFCFIRENTLESTAGQYDKYTVWGNP